jgi:hypothetical protein
MAEEYLGTHSSGNFRDGVSGSAPRDVPKGKKEAGLNTQPKMGLFLLFHDVRGHRKIGVKSSRCEKFKNWTVCHDDGRSTNRDIGYD